MRIPLLLVTLVFATSLWQGVDAPPAVAQAQFEALSQVANPLRGQHPLVLVLVIFLNNAVKAFLVLVLGLGLGVIPLLFVAVNGYTVGAIGQVVARELGLPATIGGLVPHGVIEVPALLVASAFGVAVGWETLVWVFQRSSRVRWQLRQGVQVYLRLIIPALALAAVMEVFLTPHIVRWAAG